MMNTEHIDRMKALASRGDERVLYQIYSILRKTPRHIDDPDALVKEISDALGALSAFKCFLHPSSWGYNMDVTDARLPSSSSKQTWTMVSRWILSLTLSDWGHGVNDPAPGLSNTETNSLSLVQGFYATCFELVYHFFNHPSALPIRRIAGSDEVLRAWCVRMVLLMLQEEGFPSYEAAMLLDATYWDENCGSCLEAFSSSVKLALEHNSGPTVADCVLKRLAQLVTSEGNLDADEVLGATIALQHFSHQVPNLFLQRNAVRWITRVFLRIVTMSARMTVQELWNTGSDFRSMGRLVVHCASYLRGVFSRKQSSGWVLEACEEGLLTAIMYSGKFVSYCGMVEYFEKSMETKRNHGKELAGLIEGLLGDLRSHLLVPAILRVARKSTENLDDGANAKIRIAWKGWCRDVKGVVKARETYKKDQEGKESGNACFNRSSGVVRNACRRLTALASANVRTGKYVIGSDALKVHLLIVVSLNVVENLLVPILAFTEGISSPVYTEWEFVRYWASLILGKQDGNLEKLRAERSEDQLMVLSLEGVTGKLHLLHRNDLDTVALEDLPNEYHEQSDPRLVVVLSLVQGVTTWVREVDV
ncbi:hypothetical protein VNI00_010888 [Paramarasmius palmivorus]|uniref:Uncharacterized protein n=1 Tax=Paramarasmius palmivorus TaxID=297713 RepID=A0AAW0CF56_9AGAR